MNILDYYFKTPGMGSFESTICEAWVLASPANRCRLENTFPEVFPLARMYGAGDFREFPNREVLDDALQGIIVPMNEWGSRVEAVKLPWSQIKRRGFDITNRAFGTYLDPVTNKEIDCLCFMDPNHTLNNLWFVTEEKLEELLPAEGFLKQSDGSWQRL